MILHDLKRTHPGEQVQTLSAIITFETPAPKSFEVYFEWQGAPEEIAYSADPFLIGFLTPAMLLGEKLEIRGPVDNDLVSRIREEIVPLLRRWFRSLKEIDLVCRETETPSPARGRGTASVWSSGLDASYTAVKHVDELDWLITSQGFDTRTYHQAFWDQLLPAIRNGAEVIGKPLIVVKTNLREVSHYQAIQTRRGRIDPDYYRLGHNGPVGNYLAALGRCVTPFVSKFIIAGNVAYEELYPYGSHPLLDPKWSTPTQEVIHDGCEAGRIEKIRFLQKHRPEILSKMRVCWIPAPGEINCGRCEKCIRTKAELRCADAEDLGGSIPGPIDFRAIRRLKLDHDHWFLWHQIRESAEGRGDTQLARAAAAATRRPWQSYVPKTQRRRRRIEQRKARDFWKHARKVMKPPKEARGEVPTPETILKELDGNCRSSRARGEGPDGG